LVLGDVGADVIKVEMPGRGATRASRSGSTASAENPPFSSRSIATSGR